MTDRRKRPAPPADPLVIERDDAERDGYAWQHYGRDALPEAAEESPGAPRRRRSGTRAQGEVV